MTANKEATAIRLPEAEWMLDEVNVPASEVVACCIWEYARESESFLTATTSASRLEGNVFIWERTPAARAAIDRVLDLPSELTAGDCHHSPLLGLILRLTKYCQITITANATSILRRYSPAPFPTFRLCRFLRLLDPLKQKESFECL